MLMNNQRHYPVLFLSNPASIFSKKYSISCYSDNDYTVKVAANRGDSNYRFNQFGVSILKYQHCMPIDNCSPLFRPYRISYGRTTLQLPSRVKPVGGSWPC